MLSEIAPHRIPTTFRTASSIIAGWRDCCQGVAMSLRAMMLVAMRFAAVLSMGLFLTCGEAFAEVPLNADSKIIGCRNYVASSNEDLFSQGYCAGAVQALVEFAAGACAPKSA